MVKYKKSTKLCPIRQVIEKQVTLINEQPPDTVVINKPSPGFREDSRWHLYQSDYLADFMPSNNEKESQNDLEKWESTAFMDKTYWGYYCWPAQLPVCSNRRKCYVYEDDVPSLDIFIKIYNRSDDENVDYREAIKVVRDRFKNDPAFVSKFIELSTIEESKGNEKFDSKQFYLFKCLFRNFGTAEVVNNLFGHLERLIRDKQEKTYECSHKLAAELIAGLIRGSKYWHLPRLKKLWFKLKAIFDLIIENMTNETLGLWYSCFSKISEDQDPRRLTFYLNYFQNLIKKTFAKSSESGGSSDDSQNNVSSFQQSSCLYLMTAFSQFEWRAPTIWSNLFDIFMSNMSHPYKTIREKNATCLVLSLVEEIDYKVSLDRDIFLKSESKMNPLQKTNNFINHLESYLSRAIELFDIFSEDESQSMSQQETDLRKNKEHMNAVNLLQSLMNFFSFYMMKSDQPLNRETLRLLTYV